MLRGGLPAPVQPQRCRPAPTDPCPLCSAVEARRLSRSDDVVVIVAIPQAEADSLVC